MKTRWRGKWSVLPYMATLASWLIKYYDEVVLYQRLSEYLASLPVDVVRHVNTLQAQNNLAGGQYYTAVWRIFKKLW